MSERADSAARHRALEPARSFIVQAPAGSGKTGLLTQRFLRLLAQVDAPEQIVAITFTRKAAAEMRRRIVLALAQANSAQTEERTEGRGPTPRNAERASAEDEYDYERTTHELARQARAHADARGWNLERYPARLRIHTIDAFCNSLAAQSPVLARAGAELRVADDARELYRRAAQRALARAGESDIAGGAVDLLLLHRDNQVLATANYVAAMLGKRDQWLPIILNYRGEDLRVRLEQDLAREIAGHLRAAAAAMPAGVLARLARGMAGAAERRDDDLLAMWRGRADPPSAELRDLDLWRSLGATLLTKDEAWRKAVTHREGFGPVAREAKAAVEDALLELSRNEALRCELKWLRTIPAPRLNDMQWQTVRAFVEVLKVAATELELVFRETGQVDYPAVLKAALQAIRGDGEPTELAMALDRRIRHLLVDEFQDTSLAQFELLEALTAEWTPGDGRTLFCVGDPMQSIYRFRQAEVGLFLRVREHGLGQVPLESLRLQSNFRSQRRLVEWCNEVFSAVLPPSDSIARGAVRHVASDHVNPPLDPAVTVHAAFTADAPVETAQVLATLRQIGQRLPEATIGILVRQRAHVAHIAAALREQGIRFQAVELESLESRPVVRDLLALTRALLHEADRTAWLAVLRSPMCGLSLADLAHLVAQAPDRTIRELLADDTRLAGLGEQARVRAIKVRELFDDALRPAGHRTLCRRVEGLWLALGGPATALQSAALEDAAACFDHLRELEARGPLPAGQQLDAQFADLFAEPDPGASPRLQVMTVHKAKGLEFDAVLLPGLGRGRTRNDPALLNWLEVAQEEGASGLLLAPIVPKGGERDAHALYVANRLRECATLEGARLLYVAATRARRELHVFGHVKVRELETGSEPAAPESGSPLALLWPAVSSQFRTQFELRAADAPRPPDSELPAMLRRHATHWRLPPPDSAVPVRGLKAAAPADALRPTFEWASEVSRHVGTVVHAELDRWSRQATLPAHADVAASAPRFERLLSAFGVPAAERAAALQRVIAALQRTLADERGRWLFSTEHRDVRTEFALTGETEEEDIVDVIIDRTFVDGAGTRWIVDFKTSTHEGGALEAFLDNEVVRYRDQLARYARLMRVSGETQIRLGLYFPMLGAWRDWSA